MKCELCCPDFETQKKIASILASIDAKIAVNSKINDNLQQQAMALYASMFLDNPALETTAGTLKDIADITMGQSPSGSSYNEDGNGEVFYQGRAEFGYRFPTRRLFTTEPKRMAEAGDVLLSVRAPVGDLNVAYERCCIGRGLGAIHGRNGYQSFVLYVIGQEFEGVCMMLDYNWYYEGGHLKGREHPNPDYLFEQLLYQGLTRVRSKLALIVCSDSVLAHILPLLKNT